MECHSESIVIYFFVAGNVMHGKIFRVCAITICLLSILLSTMAMYAKLYFWGGADHASLIVVAAIYYVILSGPLSAIFIFRGKYVFSAIINAMQYAILIYATISPSGS